MESTPGEEAMRIIEMTKEDLDDYTNLVDKALNRVWEPVFNFEKNILSWVKCYQITLQAKRNCFWKEVNQFNKLYHVLF